VHSSLVSLAFFQIIRTTVPLFTVGIYRIWYARAYSAATYLSLLPIVLGASLTIVGEYKYSTTGLLVTCLGVVLAAVKVGRSPSYGLTLLTPPPRPSPPIAS
jgi:hypothetical protein